MPIGFTIRELVWLLFVSVFTRTPKAAPYHPKVYCPRCGQEIEEMP